MLPSKREGARPPSLKRESRTEGPLCQAFIVFGVEVRFDVKYPFGSLSKTSCGWMACTVVAGNYFLFPWSGKLEVCPTRRAQPSHNREHTHDR